MSKQSDLENRMVDMLHERIEMGMDDLQMFEGLLKGYTQVIQHCDERLAHGRLKNTEITDLNNRKLDAIYRRVKLSFIVSPRTYENELGIPVELNYLDYLLKLENQNPIVRKLIQMELSLYPIDKRLQSYKDGDLSEVEDIPALVKIIPRHKSPPREKVVKLNPVLTQSDTLQLSRLADALSWADILKDKDPQARKLAVDMMSRQLTIINMGLLTETDQEQVKELKTLINLEN